MMGRRAWFLMQRQKMIIASNNDAMRPKWIAENVYIHTPNFRFTNKSKCFHVERNSFMFSHNRLLKSSDYRSFMKIFIRHKW